MLSHKRLTTALGVAVILSMVLAACGGPTQPLVTIVAGTPVVIEVTPTTAPVSFNSADPTTLTVATIGEPDTLDPAWDYETAGGEILENTYDTLVWYNRGSAVEFVPQLATDWTISEDGLTYTFTIREGVTFHNGDLMTPADVAWSFQRGILQGGYDSPQWLFTEPFFGIGTYDIAELVDPAMADDPEALAAADPAALLAVCERVTSAIVDNGDGTVSMHLAQPWGPFIATLAQFWGSISDKAWAIENGAWDGDCATWQNFYGRDSESTPLREIENGTGPFMLDHWTHGQEVVMVRNPNYWRTAEVGPAWEGAPTGNAALERVVILSVDEWGTRFAMLQAGDADFAVVDRSNVSQVDPLVGEWCTWNADTEDFDCAPTENPNGPLRLFAGHPTTTRQDAFFTFNMNTEGGNTFIGSGQLDGNGVPPDFFSDIHVRRAFEYCFDWDTYIAEVFNGEAVQNVGFSIPGMIGYDPNGPHYSYDLEACRAEIELAWDGQVAEHGFRLQAAYNIGNTSRQTMAEMLQAAFQDPVVDPDQTGKYLVEVIGLPWPSLLASIRASRTPIFISGWIEDIHDPHNWAGAMLTQTYASRQRMPAEMRAAFQALVDAGVAATDPAERAVIYQQLTQMDYDQAIAIRLAVLSGRHYEQRWVQGWFYNPIYAGAYYYCYSKQ